MIREQIAELSKLGPFPNYDANPSLDTVGRYENLLSSVVPPVSDEEARVLVSLLGDDEFYGLVWTVIHLVESAPRWPIAECLTGKSEGIDLLRTRVENAKKQGLLPNS